MALSPVKTHSSRDIIYTRDQIEALIAGGRKLIILDGNVLKADAWLPYHPGGDKAILHMVGRDGTNEVKAFHSTETLQSMLRYRIGKIQGCWEDFTPPIQGGTFRNRAEQCLPEEERIRTEDQDKASGHRRSESSCPVLSTVEAPAGGVTDSSKDTKSPKKNLGDSVVEDRTQKEIQHDLDLFPSLDHATQANIIARYKELDQRLQDSGLYDCSYSAYLSDAFRCASLGLLSYYFLQKGWYAMSGTFLGMMWHQLVFIVHDAGHNGITHNFHTDSCIGIVIANFIGGLSCCWWKRNHNIHHIVTNSVEHDPDIQYMPFFAISHRFFDSLKSTFYERVMTYDDTAKFVLKYQHYLYYFVLIFGRFNLYVLSWQYTILGLGPRKGPAWWHRYLELLGQLSFWYWFGYLVVYKSIPTSWERFVFIMVSHAIQMPLHVQLTLSHFAMSTADLGVAESFPQRMIRTTMDVDCPEWLDFFHGGLQFQTVHHLFPRMPRHNLRKTQKLVIEFCEAVNIPFALHGFANANKKVIGRLEEVAQQARIFAECQQHVASQDVLGYH